MLESKCALQFRHWLRANPSYSCAYEIKQSSGSSIPFSALADHQAEYLTAVTSDKGVLIRVRGEAGEPDYIYLRKFPACVVAFIGREFHIISIGTWLLERSRSKRKSLTISRAKEISTVTVSTSNVR
jgi:hypothetical protein